MNACKKGKRGERLFRDVLRSWGYTDAKRGQQHAGSPESPDVICKSLDFLHFEVKFTEALNVQKALDQANSDRGPGQLAIVAHKRKNRDWLITMDAATFAEFLKARVFTLEAERQLL